MSEHLTEPTEPSGPLLLTFRVTVCSLCLAGMGAECHVPGCAFWMADVPSDDTASRLLMAFNCDDEAIREDAQ